MRRAGAGRGSVSLRLHGPRDVPLERAVVGTGFGYDRARRERQGRVAAQLLPLVADLRRIGSAALDLCAVAAGRLDAYFEAGLNPWDYAAGALVAVEAGCSVSGLRAGRPMTRSSPQPDRTSPPSSTACSNGSVRTRCSDPGA